MLRLLLPGLLVFRARAEEYEYQDIHQEELARSEAGGTRLVGARAGDSKQEAPFLVAINTFGVREG